MCAPSTRASLFMSPRPSSSRLCDPVALNCQLFRIKLYTLIYNWRTIGLVQLNTHNTPNVHYITIVFSSMREHFMDQASNKHECKPIASISSHLSNCIHNWDTRHNTNFSNSVQSTCFLPFPSYSILFSKNVIRLLSSLDCILILGYKCFGNAFWGCSIKYSRWSTVQL